MLLLVLVLMLVWCEMMKIKDEDKDDDTAADTEYRYQQGHCRATGWRGQISPGTGLVQVGLRGPAWER